MHWLRFDSALVLFLVVLFLFGVPEVQAQTEGYIQVFSPPGLSVSLDSVFQGKTDSVLDGTVLVRVPAGIHRVRAFKEGYAPQEKEVEVKAKEVAEFTVQPFDSGAGVDSAEIPPVDFVEVDREPVVVKKAEPEYPLEAMKSGLEGKVWVKVWISKEGKPKRVGLLRCDDPIFIEPSFVAVKKFLFTPAYGDGKPVDVWVSIPFKFKLVRKN